MKPIRNLLAGSALAAAALLCGGAIFSIAIAQTTPAATTPAAGEPGGQGEHGGRGWHHHRHGGWLYSKLGLTDAQKASIKTIMQTNGPQMKALHEQLQSNSAKLLQTQPNDPNYSNVVSQTAAANASVHQQMDTLKATIRQEIFAKLTPEQQTQLQALEAQMAARRAAHGGGPPPT